MRRFERLVVGFLTTIVGAEKMLEDSATFEDFSGGSNESADSSYNETA
jgi:hypothetical protein